jgi:hypothetical protein
LIICYIKTRIESQDKFLKKLSAHNQEASYNEQVTIDNPP